MAMTYSQFISEWHDDATTVAAHTSGSTGTPKSIRLRKDDMRSSARATNAFFNIGGDSVLAIALSADYIAGKMMAVRALEAGCRLLELPVSNRLMLSEHVDLLAIVPSQVDSLLDDVDAALVGAVIIGGAPLGDDRRRRLADSGINAYTSYGMTETCSHVALAKIDRDSAPVYRAMPGVSFDVDERGCLAVTARHMSFGRLQTNDIVRLHSATSFTWLGRADNVINSGGVKIVAEQLEERLRPLIAYPFYVKGEPDPKWGETVTLVAEAPAQALAEIEAAIAATGLGVSRPRRIHLTASLPRTSNGKLRRL